MNKKYFDVLEKLKKIGAVAVLNSGLPSVAVSIAKKLEQKGITALEIAYRDYARLDYADECIRAIRDEVPSMLVGAASILNVKFAKKAKKAGAQFILSAGFNPSTVKWCIRHGVPIFPGVCSPGEIEQGIELGLSVFKFFPAEVLGGVDFLKALAGPYPEAKFIVSGGLNASNSQNYVSCSNVIAVSGSWLANV